MAWGFGVVLWSCLWIVKPRWWPLYKCVLWDQSCFSTAFLHGSPRLIPSSSSFLLCSSLPTLPWFSCLWTLNNCGVHFRGNGEHMTKRESSVHPRLCWHTAYKLLPQKEIKSVHASYITLSTPSLFWASKEVDLWYPCKTCIFLLYLCSATQNTVLLTHGRAGEQNPIYQRIIIT